MPSIKKPRGNVVPLPTAAAQPVPHPGRWRGRYPRAVVPGWRLEQARQRRLSPPTPECSDQAQGSQQRIEAVIQETRTRALMERISLQVVRGIVEVMDLERHLRELRASAPDE